LCAKHVEYVKYKHHWYVTIHAEGKYHYVGSYHDELEAAKAYNDASLHYFGKYALLNNVYGFTSPY